MNSKRSASYMAKGIFITVAIVSFCYLREFNLRQFLTGGLTALSIFAFAYYVLDPGLDNLERYTFATAPALVDGRQLRAIRAGCKDSSRTHARCLLKRWRHSSPIATSATFMRWW